MRNNKVPIVGANKLFLTFVGLFLFFQVIIGILVYVYNMDISKHTYKILLINEYVLILLPVIIYAIFVKLDFKSVFRLNKLKIEPIILIIFISIPAYFVAAMLNTIVVYLLQLIGNIPIPEIPIPYNLNEYLVGMFIVAFTPAICEEMLNRGIMLRAFENRGSTKAIIFTSILFGIFHFDITNLLGPIFLGLLIGYYTVRTNSIFAAILAHFINNGFAETLSYLLRNQERPTTRISIEFNELIGSIIYGIVALLVVIYLVKVFRNVTRDTVVIKEPISNVRGDIKSIFLHWPMLTVIIIYVLVGIFYIVSITMNSGKF